MLRQLLSSALPQGISFCRHAPSTARPIAATVARLPPCTPATHASYSSGAGSSDAVPPSNLPSGVLSSEASAAADDTIDRMPEESFPAGAKRTPGLDETMNVAAAHNSPDFPHSDQATQEGEEQEQDPDEALAKPMGGEEGGAMSPS